MFILGETPTRFAWFTKRGGKMFSFGWASRAFWLRYKTVEMWLLIYIWLSDAFALIYDPRCGDPNNNVL